MNFKTTSSISFPNPLPISIPGKKDVINEPSLQISQALLRESFH